MAFLIVSAFKGRCTNIGKINALLHPVNTIKYNKSRNTNMYPDGKMEILNMRTRTRVIDKNNDTALSIK